MRGLLADVNIGGHIESLRASLEAIGLLPILLAENFEFASSSFLASAPISAIGRFGVSASNKAGCF